VDALAQAFHPALKSADTIFFALADPQVQSLAQTALLKPGPQCKRSAEDRTRFSETQC
jgi:hypothetical protein